MHPVLDLWRTRLAPTADAPPPAVPERFAGFPVAWQQLAAIGEVAADRLELLDAVLFTPTFATLDRLLAGEPVDVATAWEHDPEAFDLLDEHADDDLGDEEPPRHEVTHPVVLVDGELRTYGVPFLRWIGGFLSQVGDHAFRVAACRYATSHRYFADDYVPPASGIRLRPTTAEASAASARAAAGPQVTCSPYAVRVDDTVVFRGWWLLDAVPVGDDRVACLVANRRKVRLDRAHPDFHLTTAADKTSGPHPTADSFGAVYLVTHRARSLVRLPAIAERIQALGRLIVLRRELHQAKEWGTALLVTDGQHLMPLAFLDTDVGELVEHEGRLVGAHGLEILGVPEALAALASMGLWTPDKLPMGLVLPDPPPPAPATLEVDDGLLNGRLVEGARPPRDDADARELGADWAHGPGPTGAIWLAQQGPDGRALAVHQPGRGRIELEGRTPTPLFSVCFDGARGYACGGSSVWEVDLEAGTAREVLTFDVAVTDVDASGDVLFVLLNVHESAGELARFVRGPDGTWLHRGGFPVQGLTSVLAAQGGRFVALSIHDAPEAIAFTVCVVFDGGEHAEARMVGRIRGWASELWDDEGVAHVQVARGPVYALDVPAPDALTADDGFLAITFDVRGAAYGKRSFFVRRISHLGYLDIATDTMRTGFDWTVARAFEGDRARVRVPATAAWGLIARDGSLALPARYAWVSEAVGDVRRVAVGAAEVLDKEPQHARWGLVHADGRRRMPPSFSALLMPGEGMPVTTARRADGSYALVAVDGGGVVAGGFDHMGHVREGFAVLRRDGRWGVANLDGSWHLENAWARASDITEGRVWLHDGSGWRCFDVASGEPVTDTVFAGFSYFHDGSACVQRDGRGGHLARDGRILGGELAFGKVYRFHGGVAPVVFLDGTMGWVREDGVRIGEGAGWAATHVPAEGRGGFRDADGAFGMVDLETGAMLASGLTAIHAFTDGVLCAKQGEGWGLLDRDGTWRVAPTLEGLAPGAEGWVRVQVGGQWGVMDRDGAMVVAPRFRTMDEIVGGEVVVGVPRN